MDGKTYLNGSLYYQRDYYKALETLVPRYIREDDAALVTPSVDTVDSIINSHISIANNIGTVLPISSTASLSFSSMDAIGGISPYFVKQNDLTFVSPQSFERKILNRVGKSFLSFNTSSEFASYLDSTLLSSFTLNNPNSAMRNGDSWSSTHEYLIENLSWLYFLNTSGPTYSPSSFVRNILLEKTYRGKDIRLEDCIKGLQEYVWKNPSLSSYIPATFLSSAGTYTSGTQQLDKLNTWVDVIYSTSYANRSDTLVKDRFSDFIDSGLITRNKTQSGPFYKFLRAIGFSFFDINDDTTQIQALYDLESCPNEYLPLLADLIGWRLFGSNPSRWRLQLRNAVEVYKRVGTKKGIQFALNSVFPKDQFSIESRMTELWESYIPYLIYYSIATESEFFKDNTTWTPTLAARMNVGKYSNVSLDDNIRLVVDRVIYEVYSEFKDRFGPIAGNYYYRGRTADLPPFEEYPYYVDVEADIDMIDLITDRLVCFGVRRDFALQVRDYMISNMLDSDDEIRSSSWLFFTSGYNEPSNLSSLMIQLSDKKFEYASLWNGKSSHFKLLLEASSFNFELDDDYSVSSGDAVSIASQVVKEFAPAHSIPLIAVQLTDSDTLTYDYSGVEWGIKAIQDHIDAGAVNYAASGFYFNAYRRDTGAGNVIGRSINQYAQNQLWLSSSGLGNLGRRSLRRRSYDNLLPTDGYYDRTGFNMPISVSMLSSLSGFPLGFIPSSLVYEDISDVHNLPGVYSRCMTLSSPEVVYGYSVSNTIPCRGIANPWLYDTYVDRGQLPPIFAIMHRIGEEAKIYDASTMVDTSTSALSAFTWKDVNRSFANSATENSGWFPNSIKDYHNFKFGIDLHTLYNQYTKYFSRHYLAANLEDLDGPNILAHTFGSILRNSDFNLLGGDSVAILTSSLDNLINLSAGVGSYVDPESGDTYYIGRGSSSIYVGSYELAASGIVNGLDLVYASGGSSRSYFRVFKLGSEKADYNPFLTDKTFIQQKSVDKLSRIRFDLKTFTNPSAEGHPVQTNFLTPECRYKFSVNALASNGNGTRLGGSKLGVWIHTKSENGKIWSYVDNTWVQHSAVVDTSGFYNYVNIFDFTERDRLAESRESTTLFKRLNCIEIVSGITVGSVDPLKTFDASDFESFSIEFDTNNKSVRLPESYFGSFGQLHRFDQNYYIEFFKLPDSSNPDYFALYESVDLVNLSYNRLSKYLASGDTYNYPLRQFYCPENRIPLEKGEIRELFSFWNNIAGKDQINGLASRDSTITSGTMGTSGGSRLDYRVMPAWGTHSTYADIFPITDQVIIIDNITFEV